MNVPSVDISAARLPAAYENAKTALAECSKLDECQDWADKAGAMASYAKQAQDESLFKYATRIKARAIRRCGELLKAIPPAGGAHWESKRDGTVPAISREQAATDAGLSERQRKTALRVATVDQASFDEQVESDAPPTITSLAEQGKRAVDLGDISVADFKVATRVFGALRNFREFCRTTDPATAGRGFKPHEIDEMRACVADADAWLDVFSVNL
jgi:hypothetical protein